MQPFVLNLDSRSKLLPLITLILQFVLYNQPYELQLGGWLPGSGASTCSSIKLLVRWQVLLDLPVRINSRSSSRSCAIYKIRVCVHQYEIYLWTIKWFMHLSQYHKSQLVMPFFQHTRRRWWGVHRHSLAQISLCRQRGRARCIMWTSYPKQRTAPAHAFFYVIDVIPVMQADRAGQLMNVTPIQ